MTSPDAQSVGVLVALGLTYYAVNKIKPDLFKLNATIAKLSFTLEIRLPRREDHEGD